MVVIGLVVAVVAVGVVLGAVVAVLLFLRPTTAASLYGGE